MENNNEWQLYTEYRDGKPHAYRYGEEWVAMQLYVEGGFPTPEQAEKAWFEYLKSKHEVNK